MALDDGSPEPWCTSHTEIASAGELPVWGEVLENAEAEVHPDDEAIVIYTSGQSAEPKGVVHGHGAILEKVHYLRDMYQFERGVECQILLPFFWVGGLTMGLLPALEVGGVAVCTDRSTWGSGQVVGVVIEQENPYAGMRMEPALGMTETFGIYSWGTQWRADGHPLCAPIDAAPARIRAPARRRDRRTRRRRGARRDPAARTDRHQADPQGPPLPTGSTRTASTEPATRPSATARVCTSPDGSET